jgi:hypothetical protein
MNSKQPGKRSKIIADIDSSGYVEIDEDSTQAADGLVRILQPFALQLIY